MVNKFLADIKIIKNAINTKKLVVFAGAGISIDAGVPSWSKLIDEIKSELDLPKDEKDFLKIPQIYYNERQEKEYVEKIRSVLKHKKIKYNEIHEEIFELNPEHILTTNFEDLLEQVISKKSLPFSVVKEDKDLPYSHNTKLLVKIHGDLDNTNFVLKEDDYLNYSYNHPLIEAFIKSIFASKVVLFIGYSYNDYNLKQIIQGVRNILGSNFQNAYLLSVDKKAHNSHRQYLKNKGINVVDYFDANFVDNKGKNQNFIWDFLNGKNVYKEKYFLNSTNFSEKGQLLHNFLRFIRHFDDLKNIINSENVINQTFESLDRFSELKSLPPNFVAKLYPFKTSNKPEYILDRTTLLIKDKILAELFYDKVIINDNSLIYKPEDNSKNNKREIDEIQKKLTSIIKKLNNSLIFEVAKENSKADSFGYKGFSSESKEIYLKNDEKCECSKCKFNRFQLSDCLIDINNYIINDITDINEDSQKAYLNYKFGNYLTSFNMYEEIATKSWQTGKYITYYIAKNNMKSLKRLISFNELNIDDEKKEKIFSTDIDTDKLIFQIPYKSNEEYELLKIIRDDTVLTESKNEIDEVYLKIEKTYNGYKSQYYTEVGPYYPQQIYIQIYKLLGFYTSNHIIGDTFYNFKKTIRKGIEALLLSHATSESYGGRLNELSADFFKFTLMYSDSEHLKKFLNKHKISKLKFKNDDIEEIINHSTNFLNSFYTKSKLHFNNSYKNHIIFNQLSKDPFENNMRLYFNNMMLLLNYIDFPETKTENFVNDLILFLEYENFLHSDSIKYSNWFIQKNYKSFTSENCLKLINIAHNKIRKHEMSETIETISYVADKNGFEIFIDKEYTIKLLTDYDFYEPRKSIIPSLWKMSNYEIKNELELILINKLKKDFILDTYIQACYSKMLDYNIFFEIYIDTLNKINSSLKKDDEGYKTINGKLKLDNFLIHNAILFIYNMKVKSTDSRLEKLENLTDYMKFYIFRDKSDISKFKTEWLLLIQFKAAYVEISKIKALKKIIENYLKINFDKEIAKIYTKYFI